MVIGAHAAVPLHRSSVPNNLMCSHLDESLQIFRSSGPYDSFFIAFIRRLATELSFRDATGCCNKCQEEEKKMSGKTYIKTRM